MWNRSASFIRDRQQDDAENKAESRLLSPTATQSSMAETLQHNPTMSAYYQTRAAHHAVVTSDWLAQAQAAVGRNSEGAVSDDSKLNKPVGESGKPFSVIDEFNNWRKQPDLAEAVAAIRALASVIRSSDATTMMELEKELHKASDSLKSWDTTSISLTAGCDLFMRYVTRTSALEYEDFNSAKSRLLERAEKFGEISYKARKIIAMLSQDFIFDGCTILVHGFSRVVLEVIKTAAQSRKLFRVLCTEGRPDRTGLRLSNELAKLDVPVKLLIDSAVAYSMDEIDMVFVGADGVVESGGIINMMGTYQIALVAKSMNKPVYVAAESYKVMDGYAILLRESTWFQDDVHIMPSRCWLSCVEYEQKRVYDNRLLHMILKTLKAGNVLFFPVCCPGKHATPYHWVLLTYTPKNTTWEMYNPMGVKGGAKDPFLADCERMKQYLHRGLENIGGCSEIVGKRSTPVVKMTEIPLHKDMSVDCSMYVLYYMTRLGTIGGIPVNLTDETLQMF